MDDPTEHFSRQPEYLLTMTQASRVLGFKDYRAVEKIANKGILTPLKVAGSKRLRFRYQDVMKLAVPIDPNAKKN